MAKSWESNSKITNLIELIPKFIDRIIYYQLHRTLNYYGSFKIGEVYELNHFAMNNELGVYKVFVKREEIKFVVITELHLLFLSPGAKEKQKAELDLCVDLREITTYKGKSLFEDMKASVGIEFNSEKVKYIEVNFVDSTMANKLIDHIAINVKRLREQFDVFQDDIMYKSEVTEDITNLAFLLETKLTAFEEDEFNEFVTREIIFLYQKIIEIYSNTNDPKYKTYMSALKDFIDLEKVKENMLTK